MTNVTHVRDPHPHRAQSHPARSVTLAAVALTLASGCSRFNRDWDHALAADRTVPPEGMVGCWQGTWTSESTGHTGDLRCIVSPLKDSAFSARFRATYCGLIPFEQTVVLTGSERGGLWRFRGEEDLGMIAGGVYTYEGESSGKRFMARYTSAKDRGIFEMTRPK